MPQFCLFPSADSCGTGNDGPIYRQNWSNFNRNDFILDYFEIDWTSLFERFDFEPDKCFNVFNDKMKVLIDRHVPTVKLTKRQIKTKLKPWITPGILKSISKRNFFHKKFVKAKNPEAKARFSALFKSYRNSIVTLTKRSKYNHFTKYFNKNSKNMQKVWSGIRDIISSKTFNTAPNISISVGNNVTTNTETVTNCFNDFFVSIADTIRSKLPPKHNHFSKFLRIPNPHSIFLTPTSPEEIAKVIGSFSASKSSGPNSIPVRVL